jgi:hypothetical protein
MLNDWLSQIAEVIVLCVCVCCCETERERLQFRGAMASNAKASEKIAGKRPEVKLCEITYKACGIL